jgi:hypothetical protein
MVRQEKGRCPVFRPERGARNLLACTRVDEQPSIAVAAQQAGRFAVAGVRVFDVTSIVAAC